MSSTPHYEERRGWNAAAVTSSALTVLIAVLGATGFAATGLISLLMLAVLAVLALGFHALVVTRRDLALRADERGITLFRPALRRGSGEFTPWSDVRGIVVHQPRHRNVVGVVRRYAGIPFDARTEGGSPKPDSSVIVTGWTLDLARLTEVVRAYAPDATIWDEVGLGGRAAAPAVPAVGFGLPEATTPTAKQVADQAADQAPEQVADQAAKRISQPEAASHRRHALLAVTSAAVLVMIIGTIAAFHKDGSDGYEVQAGPVGTPVSLSLPQQLGDLTYLMDTGSPMWQFQPQVLPSGPSSTYGTLSGSYASVDPAVAGIDIDAIYAKGGNGHVGTFTLAPQALATYAWSGLYGPPRDFPSGTASAVLECGTYGNEPLCIWAGQSVLVFVDYLGTPDTLEHLAALTARDVPAMEG